MPADSSFDHTLLDRPEVLAGLFYPRSGCAWEAPANACDLLIPVADGVVVGARGHRASPAAANILFFHGNGELAEDYDDLGALYVEREINFLVVDYRGYGRSTGRPPLRRC